MRSLLYIIVIVCSTVFASSVFAQGPRGKNFGFGLILGDPLGATVKYWTSSENAIVGDIGSSYYGSPRIQADYLWHFDAFSSNVVKMYAGPGLAIGLGEYGNSLWYRKGRFVYVRERGDVAIGVRGIFGLNIVPRRTPLEIFVEAGPLISLSPGFFSAVDAAIGVRFYP